MCIRKWYIFVAKWLHYFSNSNLQLFTILCHKWSLLPVFFFKKKKSKTKHHFVKDKKYGSHCLGGKGRTMLSLQETIVISLKNRKIKHGFSKGHVMEIILKMNEISQKLEKNFKRLIIALLNKKAIYLFSLKNDTQH